MADRHPLGQAVPVVSGPTEFMDQRSQKKCGIRYPPGQHNVCAHGQRLGNRLCAQVNIGKHHVSANCVKGCARVHVQHGLAAVLQCLQLFQHVVAHHHRHTCTPTFGNKQLLQGEGSGLRVEAAGVQDKFHAPRTGRRPQLSQHGQQVAGITGGGVLLAVFLQNGQRQFGQMVGAHVLHVAVLDGCQHRQAVVTIKAQT